MDKAYQILSQSFVAMKNCEESGNSVWFNIHREAIEKVTKNHLPHGSGFDNGVKFDFDRSTPKRLEFYLSFHHMNENGYYDGWTDHSVVVTPSFSDIDVRVTERDRDDIKEYIGDFFHELLTTEIESPYEKI